MSAYNTIIEVSKKYGQEWNVDTMLALACEYIDNQEADDAWEDFLVEAANDPDSGTCDICGKTGPIKGVDEEGYRMCEPCFDEYWGYDESENDDANS